MCKLCGEESFLVQSHIIPRAFFGIEGGEPLKLVSNVAGQFPRRAPNAVYDRIVCDRCEKGFSRYDNYAAKVLLRDVPSYKRIEYRGKLIALQGPRADYTLLKLFLISVLWRAAVATHNFYTRVQIGPFQQRAKEMLLAGDPGNEREFATWWAIFDTDIAPAIMDPFRERYFGVTAYRFYFGKVLGYIKVDRQAVPEAFREITLGPGTRPNTHRAAIS